MAPLELMVNINKELDHIDARRAIILTPKPNEVKPFEKDVKDWIRSLKKPYGAITAVDLLVNAGWRATLFLVDAIQDENR